VATANTSQGNVQCLVCHAAPIGGTYVRCCGGGCVMRPRTHDDVPTGNVGPGLPRAIPPNLELDEMPPPVFDVVVGGEPYRRCPETCCELLI
jgi:hypothetical protein